MPQPVPSPLPKWARTLYQLEEAVLPPYLQGFLEWLGDIKNIDASGENEWRHFQFVFVPSFSTDPAEVCITTMDVLNTTGGVVDATWTQADYDTIGSSFSRLLPGVLGMMSSTYTCTEVRAYRRAFNPMSNPKPFALSGPPEYVYASQGSGALSSPLPGQVSVTSTDITTYPRHWGRNYWPGISAATVGAAGQLGTVYLNALVTAVHDCYQFLYDAEFLPVVPVTQQQKVPFRGLLGVTKVQVDSVFDIQRRRRVRRAAEKVSLPL